MRGAQKRQEGAFLICDGDNVLKGAEKPSEGRGGGSEAASLDDVLVALRAFVDALDNLREVITPQDGDTGND